MTVYHAGECRVLKYARWADDVTAQWGELRVPVQHGPVEDTFHAKKISIMLDRHLIIINPIEDETDQEVSETLVESR